MQIINRKGIGKAGLVALIAIILIPISYAGLTYASITSAKYSISNPKLDIGLSTILNPSNLIDLFLSRTMEGSFDLLIEGRGWVSVTVKSIQTKIFFEDVYVGNFKFDAFFQIPASGIEEAHMNFRIDLSSISLNDVQKVADSMYNHNGEVKISLQGIIEPIFIVFPITIPISVDTYTLTYSNGPIVTALSWDSLTCDSGEQVSFRCTIQNVYRGNDLEGVLYVLVKEDVSFSFDKIADQYQYPIKLHKGETSTITGKFITYKASTTRGFFLKIQWNDNSIAEQESNYPPRLRVLQGNLKIEQVSWIVEGKIVLSCLINHEVEARILLKAYNGSINGGLKIKIRKDLALLPDNDFIVKDYIIQLKKSESQEINIKFTPDEVSGILFRGYFIELEGVATWTQTDSYPPRLKVDSIPQQKEGILSIQNVWWSSQGSSVTSVTQGAVVSVNVRLLAVDGNVNGTLTIKIRKDMALLPDSDHTTKSYNITLSKDQETTVTLPFIASEYSSSSFRGYFVEITGKATWTMSDSYPPRLNVIREVSPEPTGTPSIQSVWWTVNNYIVTEAVKDQTVNANVRISAVDGQISGVVTIRIRKDIALLPDEDYVIKSYNINLVKDQSIDIPVSFVAAEKTGFTFRGYFVHIDLASWSTSWDMENSYPPRLKIN